MKLNKPLITAYQHEINEWFLKYNVNYKTAMTTCLQCCVVASRTIIAETANDNNATTM